MNEEYSDLFVKIEKILPQNAYFPKTRLACKKNQNLGCKKILNASINANTLKVRNYLIICPNSFSWKYLRIFKSIIFMYHNNDVQTARKWWIFKFWMMIKRLRWSGWNHPIIIIRQVQWDPPHRQSASPNICRRTHLDPSQIPSRIICGPNFHK